MKLLLFVLYKRRGNGRTLSRGTNWHLPFAENLILKPVSILFYLRLYFSVTLENSRHFAMPPLIFRRNDVWGTKVEIPCWWRIATYPDISSASDWLDICFNQSEALFRSGLWVERHQYGSNYCASGFFTWSLGETSGGGRLEM